MSSKFYTYIPHNFRTKNLSGFIIDNKNVLQAKLDLIQNLIDIKIAHQMMNPEVKDTIGPKISVIDENYAKLKCDMSTLQESSDEYKLVAEFLENTRGH